MSGKNGPAFELVDSMLDYNRNTGLLWWKKNRPKGRKDGEIAGTKGKDGYIRIHINRQSYSAPRIAVLLETGQYPLTQVHFKNDNRSDMRWDNLVCGDSGYVRQSESARIRGERLRWDARQGKWAMFCSEGKHLGYFSSYADAAAAYSESMRSGAKEVVNEFWSCAQYQWR